MTANYIAAYARIPKDAKERLKTMSSEMPATGNEYRRIEIRNAFDLVDFELIISVREIESVTIFNPDIYCQYFAEGDISVK